MKNFGSLPYEIRELGMNLLLFPGFIISVVAAALTGQLDCQQERDPNGVIIRKT